MKLKKIEKKAEKEISANITCDLNRGKWHNFFLKPEMNHKEIIDSEEALESLCKKMMKIPAFAFDTETNSLRAYAENKDFRCADITVSWGEDNNYEIVLGHIREEDADRNISLDVAVPLLKPVFEREDVLIIGHNVKFDMHVLKRIGIDVKGKLFDTMLASWLVDENTPNGLKENSAEKMGIAQTKFKEVTEKIPNDVKKLFGYKANAKVHDFGMVLVDDGAEYCIGDAFYTWCLYCGFEKELKERGLESIYYNRMIPFLRVLYEMEEKGVTVDVARLDEMSEEMKEDIDELTYKIYELAGVEFNIGSVQQKSLILFGIDDYTVDFETFCSRKLKKIDSDYALYVEKIGLENSIMGAKKKYPLPKAEFIREKRTKAKETYDKKQNDAERLKLLKKSFGFKPTAYTDTGNPSTDSDSIWRLSRQEFKNGTRKAEGAEMCKVLNEYSKLSKLYTAFVEGLKEQLYDDNKAHPSFNQTGTDSGRLSCSQPNLQQLPKADEDAKYQIRSLFIGSDYFKMFDDTIFNSLADAEKEGYDEFDIEEVKRKKIIAIDYHNLEMVCLTHFSHDKNLSEMFANDDDAHGSTAVNMFNLDCTPVECKKKYPHLRQAAKTINFLLMYGGGAGLLYDNLRSDHSNPLDLGSKDYLEQYHVRTGRDVAQIFIDKYFTSYAGVAKFIREQKKFAHRNGYVQTITGRKRTLPDINSSDGEKRSYSERLAVNSAIQGTAADITIGGQLRVQNEHLDEKYGCNMLLQIHDELVFECPEEYVDICIPILKYDMEHPFGDKDSQKVSYLRADYDVGNSYQEAK